MKPSGYAWTIELEINRERKIYQVETKYSHLPLAKMEVGYIILGEDTESEIVIAFVKQLVIKIITGPEPIFYDPSSKTGGGYQFW